MTQNLLLLFSFFFGGGGGGGAGVAMESRTTSSTLVSFKIVRLWNLFSCPLAPRNSNFSSNGVTVRVCRFPRHPKSNVPPESIRNGPLLCPHEKFLFNPECDVEDNGASEV